MSLGIEWLDAVAGQRQLVPRLETINYPAKPSRFPGKVTLAEKQNSGIKEK